MADVRRWTLSVALLAAFFVSSDAGFGAISIDFGSQFLKVGLIKPGVPMEIVLNKESHRKTPNVLSIRNEERLFGDAAQALSVRYPSSVYCHLLDLVAKHTDHPSVQLFRKRFPNLYLEKHENESSVVFPIGGKNYPVETLLAMILTNVREFTEVYAEMSLRDVVISVPVFFTQPERLIIEKAAEIAGMNLLQLINGGTAAGLNYGMFRRKEVTDKPQRMLIYDMGAGKTVATLVEYKLVKGKYEKEPTMTVLGVGFDRYLGGLEMTLRLRELLVEKFRQNYKSKADITTSERGMAKLLKEAERLKQVLSANVDYFAQVESVHEDIDMRFQVTREEFNKLIDDLMPRVAAPMDRALKMAELTLEQVDQVVLMGAGTRVPRVQEELQKFIGSKELGRFLNTDEAIAMGGLFQAAHLSKGFKVKSFGVEELVVFPIQVNFISKQKQDDGNVIEKPITRQVFQYKGKYPTNKKTITFTSYTDDFSFDLNYSELKHFNEDQIKEFDSLIPHVTTVTVSNVGKALEDKLTPGEMDFVGVKVGFQMDLSGILRIEKAEAVIRRKSQGVVESSGGGSDDSRHTRDSVLSTITKTISGFFSKKTEEGEPVDSEERKDEDGMESTTADEKVEMADEKPPTQDEKPADEESKPKEENKTDESKEEEKEEEKKEEKAEDGEKKTEGEEKPGVNKTAEDEKAKKNATAEEKPKVPEVIRVTLKTKEKYTNAHMMSKEDVAEAKKILEQFEKRERQARDRAAAENELEAFAFEVSRLVEDEDYVKHSTEEERNKLTEEAKRIRTWLEDDTTPETKTIEFTKNLITLQTLAQPVKRRIEEGKTLGPMLKNLESVLNSSRVMASMGGDDEKSLFNKSDAEAFSKKLDRLTTWLEEKKTEQEKRQPYEEPAVTTNEVAIKMKALDRELNSFMKKMKKTRIKDVEDAIKKDGEKGENKTEKAATDGEEGKKEGEETQKKEEKAEGEGEDVKKEEDKPEEGQGEGAKKEEKAEEAQKGQESDESGKETGKTEEKVEL